MKDKISKPFGARVVGKYSGRPFDPTRIGIPIRRLSSRNIRVKHHAVDVVEKHLPRFTPNLELPERIMLERLRRIADGKMLATEQV